MTAISTAIRKDDNIIEGVICTTQEIVGDAVYFSGPNMVSKASALSLTTSRVVGFITAKKNNLECTVRIGGFLEKSGLVENSTYFLDIVPGQITVFPPTLSGSVVVKVGIGKSSSSLLVEVSQNRVIRN